MARAKHKGKRRNRVEFKWSKELGFFLAGMAVCIALLVFCLIPTKQKKFYNKWAGENSTLNKDNQFEEISYKKLKSKVEKNETVYVFYGTENDDASKTNLATLDYYTNQHKNSNEAKHFDVGTIYVYNAKEAYELDKDNDKKVNALQEKEDWINSIKVDSSIKDIDLTNYSQLLIFKSGQLVFSGQDITSDSQAQAQSADFTLACVKFLSFELSDSTTTK
ncbi:MAG: hypothetical protein K6G28_02975 [Acholeplasmatales bacterium]|nr:hypothetical protein [Acholeplasmatales bacterium]